MRILFYQPWHPNVGYTVVTNRMLRHLPISWKPYVSHLPKYYKANKYSIYGLDKMVFCGISKKINFKYLQELWKNTTKGKPYLVGNKLGLIKENLNLRLKSNDISIPKIDVFVFAPACPSSLYEWVEYAKTVYEFWKVNNKMLLVEIDGDFLGEWRSFRREIFHFLDESQILTVTPYVPESIPKNWLFMAYGLDKSRFMPVRKGNITFGFVGTNNGRTEAFNRLFKPVIEEFSSSVFYGNYYGLEKDYPGGIFFPGVDYTKYISLYRDFMTTCTIVSESYKPVGLMPLRVYETLEIGVPTFVDGEIFNAADYYHPDFFVTGENIVEKIKLVKNLSYTDFLSLVAQQRDYLLDNHPIELEVKKFTDKISNMVEAI